MSRSRHVPFERHRRESKTPDLEERIEAAFTSTSFAYVPKPRFMRAPAGQETEALPAHIVLAEGTCAVRLPSPNASLMGMAVIVVREGTSGTVTVIPTSGTVSGSVSVAITTGQQRTFWCSGDDWH